jgi:hypothetical protein
MTAAEPDAKRFCEECGRWTPHDMEENGRYSCRICPEGSE